MFRRHASRLPRSLQAFLGLFGLVLILSACGGGPTVATSTGRVLYVATNTEIYGFSIMSTGTLNPLSTQPLFSKTNILQIAATPGIPPGQSGPLLLAATGTSSVSAWTIGGGGSLTPTTSLSCSSSSGPGAVTGLTVTSDSQYLILVDGNASSNNLGLISFSNSSTCTTESTSSSSNYPIQPAIDCVLPASSSCILFLAISSASISSSTFSTSTLTTPQEIQVTLSPAAFTVPSNPSPFSCTEPGCPFGVAFDPTTVFFYASFPGATPPTLQSIAEGSKTATSQVSFPSSAPVNYPCVDTIGGVVYTPSSNGYLYASQTNASGGLSAPSTVLTPSSLPTSLDMVSCAVVSNP